MSDQPVRPSIPMSQEEHSAIMRLTSTVEVLVTGLTDLKNVVKDMGTNTDARFNALAERGRFTRGDVFAFVSSAFAVLSGVGLLISMNTDVKLAPIQTQNQVSIVDREGLHGDVDKIYARIDAGKEARFASEKDRAAKEAILFERTNELYRGAHGHYPNPVSP